ncbi:MAG: wax ester/triacylglycerol synthase domain-containing protein [Acidimicrobiales bacterium]
MSDAEALMWAAERDPVLRSAFLNVTICDGPLDIARFRRRMALVVEAFPRLRQRVVERPFGAPVWRDDPAFDLDHHVRHVALAAPGSDRQLLDLAGDLIEDVFDPARPLWTFLVVEGLNGGRGALVSKLHHTITDGVGGVRMSGMFIDLAADQDHPSLPAPPAEAPLERGPVAAVADFVGRQAGTAARVAAAAGGSLTDPVTTARAIGALLPLDRARSPLWRRRGLRRRLEALSVDLDEVKAAAKAYGGSVNDVFVCALAEAVGAYHRARCVEVGDLRVAVPVSTRDERTAGGNAFVPTRLLVPCGDLAPETRFALVHGRLRRARAAAAPGLISAGAGLLTAAPPLLVARLARQQTSTVDFGASNVRGAPFELWMAGAKILHNHPMGPTGGTAFVATVLSTAGTLDLGLSCDVAAVLDPAELRDRIAAGFATLLGP